MSQVQSDHAHDCPHCAIADAVNDWFESPGAAAFVDLNRTTSPEQAYRYSDEQLVRIGLIRALAIVAIDLIFAEEDGLVRVDMIHQFSDSAAEEQVRQNTNREAGDTI